MSDGSRIVLNRQQPLPPLILHPFTESTATVRVLESARASLSLLQSGASGGEQEADLERRMLEGRFTEFRMLYYVGKDVLRWLDQCVDTCRRSDVPGVQSIPAQSFARLLIEHTPEDVAIKLRGWGVVEYARIFSRSIGIFTQFRNPPEPDMLQPDYLRYYYRYADYAYSAWQDLKKAVQLDPSQFPFALYASGEYARMLEQQWNDG